LFGSCDCVSACRLSTYYCEMRACPSALHGRDLATPSVSSFPTSMLFHSSREILYKTLLRPHRPFLSVNVFLDLQCDSSPNRRKPVFVEHGLCTQNMLAQVRTWKMPLQMTKPTHVHVVQQTAFRVCLSPPTHSLASCCRQVLFGNDYDEE
jgi:hypothetical protein